ncbi:Cytochrome d ubiquinol oxidase subunit 1 [Candidatus Trichorickettsia mobilis]|uniref:Cytochrome d ubiquinol oxidase subunit 1 n=1 Tax=Candidatus Trichorickettsia mobilis TaxID=1346319 RepID=A0ABZ0UQH8_9RICK|nr:cytochrome ubiquinol oxidase subunit I [Candidatus Trichorickettsia mobilis]WPY00304.1 Cytochrome d ubiquinol oxidase subunit 1 [Candidatus Trichorickettsia mobilis]
MEHIVDLSRLQFAITAIYHFLFVPLTLGLALLLAVMESVYVMSGHHIWRSMTKFWGKLFAINFAMGVATGITMEFQFGTNWAYFSHYVGDIFGVPLAIEGLMAFFLESTFVGLFLFGWDKMSKLGHLLCTWLMAIGANFSALWILIANGWMQNPVGAVFNPESMRMEIESITAVIFNPVAQAKFVHTVSAGYVTGAMFVLSISCYYLLAGKFTEFAKRSIIISSSFGLLSALSVVVLGDESGYLTGFNQKMKMAAIEAIWETEKAPAPFTLFGIPNQEKLSTDYTIKIPYLMGIIGTRSLDQEILGIKELVEISKSKIIAGLVEYEVLLRLKNKESQNKLADIQFLRENYSNIGYALLLKKYRVDILNSTQEEIDKAAWSNVPKVLPLFFSFRIMVACGVYFIVLFTLTFYWMNICRNFEKKWLLKLSLLSLPLPWLAAELGWIVAELGRQPWAIHGILPTFLGVSPVSNIEIISSIIGFVVLYTLLLVIDIFLMVKTARTGPEHFLQDLKN